MSLKKLMMLNSIFALLFGIAFLIAPSFVLSTYGGTQGPTEKMLAQLFSVCLLQFSVIIWFLKDSNDARVIRTVSVSLLITDFIAAAVAAKATISGVMNTMGWGTVLIYLLLGVGYFYFQFLSPQKDIT